jgi:hypothetical protein
LADEGHENRGFPHLDSRNSVGWRAMTRADDLGEIDRKPLCQLKGRWPKQVCNQKRVCAVRESTDKADFHAGDEGLDLVRSDKPIEPIAPE